MTPRKIIIDTDPGCDDVLAMLLAFSALPSELQVLMISVTYGNVDVKSCMRNVISTFHHIDREVNWRKQQGREIGFDTLLQSKPLIAAGPDHPLAEQMLMADYFHGRDGLGDTDVSHPHMTPGDTWEGILKQSSQFRSNDINLSQEKLKEKPMAFIPSHRPAHEEILRLLRENEPDTITIVAIGPLTNLAIAAAADTETFLRVKEVVVMGGAIDEPGNITPKAEFNTFADSIAAARLYALSSPDPSSTMPPAAPIVNPNDGKVGAQLDSYPQKLSRRLNVTLFPLDITSYHLLWKSDFRLATQSLMDIKSPLAEWVSAWLDSTFRTIANLHPGRKDDDIGLQLHDPLTIWYCMTAADSGWKLTLDEDIRVETTGQWTRGMCVVDGRSRKKKADDDTSKQTGDHGEWLRGGAGNRLSRCVESPGRDVFATFMLNRIFGLSEGSAER